MKKLLPLLRDFVRRADMFLFTMSVICAVYGIVVIASATQSYANGSAQYVIVQTLALGLGVLLFIAMTVIDVDIFAQHWAWLYGLSAALLISLIFFGAQSDTGNNGWLRFFGIGIQPTEIVKIAFIIVMAKQLSYLKEYKNLNSVTSIAQIVVHFVLMFGLILVTAQDLGSALVYFFIFAVMLFVAGVRIYWFVIGLAALAGMVPILWTYFLEDYQKDRILAPYDSSIDPDNTGINWQQNQSKIALASGQLTGTGLGEGTQSQSTAIPGKHTDFIFAVVGEELGMIGACLVLLLLMIIVIRCIQVGLRSGNTMSMLVCFGVAATVVFQTFENVSMCIGIAPVIGITLPFFSYGGSSLFSMFAAMGLVSGIKYRPKPTRASLYGR
ncbi:MAG TPA: rod shape-determining protein RodA [Candidatus Scatomorpha merdavium]|nr:rod shape-determining protein RodA [Candidatus Scatomorpha merdavium]